MADEQVEPVPAVQLAPTLQLGRLWRDTIVNEPAFEAIMLPVDSILRSKRTFAPVVELSTRGVLSGSVFLRLVIEWGQNDCELISFGQNQAMGSSGRQQQPRIRFEPDWGPADWVRWVIQFQEGQVSCRAARHNDLRAPFMGITQIDLPDSYKVKALVIGTAQPDPVAIAEVRLWENPFAFLDDQLELLGGRRLDGRESALIGYWKLDEGDGATLRDSSRFGRHGTLYGGHWLQARDSGLQFHCSLEVARRQQEQMRSSFEQGRRSVEFFWGCKEQLDRLDKEIKRIEDETLDIRHQRTELLAGLRRDRDKLKQEFELWHQNIKDHGRVALDKFGQSLSDEVEQASAQLVERNMPYQLDSVAIEAKFLPVQPKDTQDFMVVFPQPSEQNIQAAQLSTLNLRFEPQLSAPPRTNVVVPDVHGYTEMAARRLLEKNGLQAEVLDQATDNPEEADRVIGQQPSAGTETGRDFSRQTPVRLFLGRAGAVGNG